MSFLRTVPIAIVILQSIGSWNAVCFVASLSTRSQPTKSPRIILDDNLPTTTTATAPVTPLLDRRTVFRSVIDTALVAATLSTPTNASAGIDVSSLKVEENPLDIFLGGTYFESDDSREGIDGRIARRKYTIVEAPSGGSVLSVIPRDNPQKKKVGFFDGLERRQILIRGESTSISSSRDDALELTGELYLCSSTDSGSKGCITIDFSPLGGPTEVKGYWDSKEEGIRFVDRQTVWSKQ